MHEAKSLCDHIDKMTESPLKKSPDWLMLRIDLTACLYNRHHNLPFLPRTIKLAKEDILPGR